MPLDYLSCFAVVLRRIYGNIDICQTNYTIPSALKFSPYSEVQWKYNIQVNERLTKVKEKWSTIQFDVLYSFIFFIPMSQTISVINRSDMCSCLYLMCAIAHAHASTCATSLMCVKNSMYHFCLWHLSGTLEWKKWNKDQKHCIE